MLVNLREGSDLHWASTQEFLLSSDGPRTLDVMSEAHEHPAVSESLSWAEICDRYSNQWVALVEIEWEDEDVVRAARVAGAGPRRADPLAQARALQMQYEEIGHFYTGRVRAPLRGSMPLFAAPVPTESPVVSAVVSFVASSTSV